MKRVVIITDKILYKILMDDEFDHFKVTQLRDLYLALSTKDKICKDAYQYLYRQINKWKKLKIIEKKGTGKQSFYSKTKLFSEMSFTIDEEQSSTVNDSRTILHSRLTKFESDLLSNIGESEEYKKLRKSLPQLHDYLEPKYLFAMENHLKILGKIKAVKSVILHMDES